MKSLHCAGLLATVLLVVIVLPAAASSTGTKIDFSSLDTNHPINVSGTLYLPENAHGPVPAIVLIHGTMGIDQRGELYRQPLLDAGIAIFEVDFKTGIYKGPMDRPKPDTFLPMAFAALKQLRKLPTIDPNRIGVMGFSMGGHIALETALENNRKQWMGDDKGFIAFATFYPVCKPFIKDLEKSGSKLTGAPIIVFYGTEDSYDEGKAVPELKSLLAEKYNFQLSTVEYPGATHGFNRNAPPMHYPDPAAKHFRGYMAWNPEAANDSITKVVAFLRENLAAK
ncbi:MAG TPA: dienelactone hydrolase family protein [Candidatus Acidoferrum sp.]|nr:dienelactone hydrolase family protein [Candidatus Acidoferrum sp.]